MAARSIGGAPLYDKATELQEFGKLKFGELKFGEIRFGELKRKLTTNSKLLIIPGAAHTSRMMSPGRGSSTWTQTIDGKFCGNETSLAKSANDGATYSGSVIRTPTPALPQTHKNTR